MSHQHTVNTSRKRKPRVALMGEFSSGKSTLSNLLLGEEPLPMKVTATQLPPVLITHGEPATFVVSHDGTETKVNPEDIENICFDNTRMIRLHRLADVLQICDLIDTPGISDPNMSAQSWHPVIDDVDCIVWCTHATQAWRQSEAAMWDQISTNSRGNDILLVTQFDKMRTQAEGERVLNRLRTQTKGQFKEIFPVSLIQAIEASDNFSVWQDCGVAPFIEFFVPHLMKVSKERAQRQPGFQRHTAHHAPEMIVEHVAEVVEAGPITPVQAIDHTETDAHGSVRPRRVRIKTRIRPRTPRPDRTFINHEEIAKKTQRDPIENLDRVHLSERR